MDLITSKGPSKRNEIFYFAESTLGAVRHRAISNAGSIGSASAAGWVARSRSTGQFSAICLRLDSLGTHGVDRFALLTKDWVRLRVLALLPLCSRKVAKYRPDFHQSPADAEGCAASIWQAVKEELEKKIKIADGTVKLSRRR